MNNIVFKFTDESDKKYELDYIENSSKLEISDTFIYSFFRQFNIEKIKNFSLTIGASNMALVIKNYTLTDTIYINGFYNIKSYISIFQTINVNIHITEQTIGHLQADCKSLLLADCSVDKFEFGIFYQVNHSKSGNYTKIFKADSLDLRDVEIKNLDIYAEYKHINIQGSHIGVLNSNCNPFAKNFIVKSFHLWQNATIGKLILSNHIEKMKCDTTTIDKIYARSNLLIDQLELIDSIAETCYGFKETNFSNHCYESWQWIGKSAENAKNTHLRAVASYQMIKYSYNTERKGDKIVSKLFDFCAGYGYKPLRIARTSTLVILINTIIFTIIDFFAILGHHSIPINISGLFISLKYLINNLVLSISAFAGQSGLSSKDGLLFWFAMVEYLTGVILFAMFVNALYLRYKE